LCGAKSRANNPVTLNAHHIKPFAINKELRFIINFRNAKLVFNFEQKTLISTKEFDFTIQGIDEAFDIIFKEQKQSEFLRIKGDRILNLKVDSDIDLEFETSDPANVEWYSENDEVASVEDGNVVGEGVGETNIVAKLGDLLDSIKIITHPTLVSPIIESSINKVVLSDKAREFVNTYMNILDEVEENLDLLIDLYDELEESDYTFPEVIDAISTISEYYKSEKNNINKVRYIYASKSFLKKIKEVEIEYQKNLEEIQERLYKLEKEEFTMKKQIDDEIKKINKQVDLYREKMSNATAEEQNKIQIENLLILNCHMIYIYDNIFNIQCPYIQWYICIY
jgi:hypothetical protein